MCANGVRLFRRDVRTVFVRSVFIGREPFSSLDSYKRVLNNSRPRRMEGRLLLEQRICAAQEFGARKKLWATVGLSHKKPTERREWELGKCYFCFCD